MGYVTRHKWLGYAGVLGAALLACNSSAHHPVDAGAGGFAGSTAGTGASGSGGAGGQGGGPAPIVPLPDNTAGKACSANSDCGNGSCAMTLGGNAFAAGMSAPDGYCTGPCQMDSDCGKGGMCVGAFAGIAGFGMTNGQCYATCQNSSDCRDGYRCGNGVQPAARGGAATDGGTPPPAMPSTCQPKPGTDRLDDGIAGAMCTSASDCPTGSCLTMTQGAFGGAGTTYPGGYCTGRCLEDADCGKGGVCAPGFAGGAGGCYRSCSGDADCARDGYRCRTVSNGLKGCAPGSKPLPDNAAGRTCTADADCGGGGMCATMLPSGRGGFGAFGGGGNVTAPGGYCSERCVDDSDCGAGGVCVGGGGGTTASGTCWKRCSASADCREEYTCAQRGGAFGAPSVEVCAPAPMMSEADAGSE